MRDICAYTLSAGHNLEDENCRENENGKMEKEKIENVGSAKGKGKCWVL